MRRTGFSRRGKRIDRHIDYFGSGAVTASFSPASPLNTKV